MNMSLAMTLRNAQYASRWQWKFHDRQDPPQVCWDQHQEDSWSPTRACGQHRRPTRTSPGRSRCPSPEGHHRYLHLSVIVDISLTITEETCTSSQCYESAHITFPSLLSPPFSPWSSVSPNTTWPIVLSVPSTIRIQIWTIEVQFVLFWSVPSKRAEQTLPQKN